MDCIPVSCISMRFAPRRNVFAVYIGSDALAVAAFLCIVSFLVLVYSYRSVVARAQFSCTRWVKDHAAVANYATATRGSSSRLGRPAASVSQRTHGVVELATPAEVNLRGFGNVDPISNKHSMTCSLTPTPCSS